MAETTAILLTMLTGLIAGFALGCLAGREIARHAYPQEHQDALVKLQVADQRIKNLISENDHLHEMIARSDR